ncbi:unnamed protein product, partial [Mesorhabditis belari]|uniref:G protein-coupled receptor n=1 Tax=Mesorhabditis belari TaxID=2138241 RepID=A0AAF3EQV2_9BILA
MEGYFRYGSLAGNPKYSCLNVTLSYAEMAKRNEKNPLLGGIYLISGILVQLAYLLTLSVIGTKEFRQMSCYKLMLVLGIMDTLCIILSCDMAGYFYAIGAEYCMFPRFQYVAGSVTNGVFNSCCALCLFLVINRFVDFWKPHVAEFFFKDNRTWFFVAISIVYGIFYAIIPPPILFNANYGTWIYHPFIPGKEKLVYISIYQTISNFIVAMGIFFCYLGICILHAVKTRGYDIKGQSATQKKIMIQAVIVCFFTMLTTGIWASMAFIPPTMTLMHIGHASWQLMHGTPALVYLFLNRSIQKRVLQRVYKLFYCRDRGLRFIGVRLHKSDHILRQLKSTLMAFFYFCLGLYVLLVDIRIVIEKHEIENTVTPTGIVFIMWNIQTLISQIFIHYWQRSNAFDAIFERFEQADLSVHVFRKERLRSQRTIKAIYSSIAFLIPIYLIFLIITKFFINITYAYTGSDHVYSFLMICTNVPTFMFLFIRLLTRDRWGDILHAIPGAIIYTYTYLGLTVVPARMQGELYKAKPILCANEAIWVPHDSEVNRLARTLAMHFDQSDLGISLELFKDATLTPSVIRRSFAVELHAPRIQFAQLRVFQRFVKM